MRSFVRRSAWLLLLLLLAAGCTEPAQTEAENPPPPWEQEETYIQFLYPGTSEPEKLLAEMFKEKMEQKYENLHIEYIYVPWQEMEQKIEEMLARGDAPDLAQTQNITHLVHKGYLEDLTPYLNRHQTGLNESDFLNGTLDYSMVDGKIYALPNLANTFSLIVNERMLAEVGLAPEDLQTWEDLEQAAMLMTREGTYGYGYPLGVARYAFRVPFMVGYSNDVVISDLSEADKSKFIEILEHFKRLEPYQPRPHLNWGYPEMFRAYSLGEVGMIPAGTFFSASVYSVSAEILQSSRAIAYPVGPSAARTQAPVSSVGTSMFAASQNKEMAWRLIEEWSSQEFNAIQAATVNVTALKTTSFEEVVRNAERVYPKAIEGHTVLIRDFTEMIDAYGVPMDKILGQSEIENVFQELMLQYVTNKISAEKMYDTFIEKLEQINRQYAEETS